MKAIRVHRKGGPEVLGLEDLPTPRPGAGQVLVRVEAAGVNFLDVYMRTGAWLQQKVEAKLRTASGQEPYAKLVDDRSSMTFLPSPEEAERAELASA